LPEKRVVDASRTDYPYWDAVLKQDNLGMNRGMEFPEAEKILNEIDRKKNRKLKKPGRHFKRGPKGPRAFLAKAEAVKATRATMIPTGTGGVQQLGGIVHYGNTYLIGAGKGQRGGKKGSEVNPNFIQFSGGMDDLARLEDSFNSAEQGRVSPQGHGPA
jgi:hypothetical protein